MRRYLLPLIAILFVISTASATDAPKWTDHYVNDYAGVLNNKAQLESMLQSLEKNTTVEFAVVTLSQIPSDETKETYSYKIFNTWGIGKKGSDNGLLLMIIVNGTSGNRMRMEVGYGLEGYITDAAAGRMLDDALPYYEKGDYSTAAYTVVSEVKQKLEENYIPGNSSYNPFIRSFNERAALIGMMFVLIPIIFAFAIPIILVATVKPKCPSCNSKNLVADGDYYICQNCKKRFKKSKAKTMHAAMMGAGAGAGWGGGGFGGGFGGGGSGGGGAGR